MVERGGQPVGPGRVPPGSGGTVEPTGARLMEAALVVFGRKGFEDARVEDICQVAGSARATFYRHFGGKDEIFDALLTQLLDEVDALSAAVDAVTPDRAGFATLRHMVDQLMAVMDHWAPVVEALSVPGRVSPERRRRATATLVTMSRTLAHSIELGQRKGTAPTGDHRRDGEGAGSARTTALAVVALIDGFAHQVRTWDISSDRDSTIDAVTALALRMLHPDLVMADVVPAA